MQIYPIEKHSLDEKYTFNGGIIIRKEDGTFDNVAETLDKCILINIYRNTPIKSKCPSRMSCKELTKYGNLFSNNYINIFDYTGMVEDPRIFVRQESEKNGRKNLCISYTINLLNGLSIVPKMAFSYFNKFFLGYDNVLLPNIDGIQNYRYDDNLSDHVDNVLLPNIGGNLTDVRCEKNWLFFDHKNENHVVYNLSPFIDINLHTREVISHEWEYLIPSESKDEVSKMIPIVISGGSPPVLVDNHYIFFAHTREKTSIYRLVIVCADENLNIISYSLPISINDFKIVFPCGAIYVKDEDKFYISCGVNDESQILITMTKGEVQQRLVMSPKK